jgi:DNA-binding NarL/FixJ family response regulator
MIRVAVVDDHPAVRIGLQVALRSEPGLVPVGTAATDAELGALISSARPDVVVLDYHLPDTDGLTACRRIKANTPATAVLLYSAFADDSLTVPAIVAGADGVVSKSAPPQQLYEGVRRVARGESVHPPIRRPLLHAATATLEPQDRPLLAMVLERTPPVEIAAAMGLDAKGLDRRMTRMLACIRVPVSANAAPPADGAAR